MTLTETANDMIRIARNFELYDTVAASQALYRERRTAGAFELHLACVAMWRALAQKGGN